MDTKTLHPIPTWTLRLLGLVCLAAVGCGCGGSEDDVVYQYCNRLDECDWLAEGWSVQDCVEYQNKCILSSERQDWEMLVGECIELNSCADDFADCMYSIPPVHSPGCDYEARRPRDH